MPTLTVVLPTYNERGNIGPLITGILEYSTCPTQVIVVDDDSPDGTWQVVEAMAASDRRIRLIRRIGRRGLTSAFNEGIAAANTDAVAWMDSDLTMPPAMLPKLVAALEGADLVVGSRYLAGGRDARPAGLAKFLSRLINLFAALVLGTPMHDYTSGFVCAKRRIFDRIRLRGDYGEYCIDLMCRAMRQGDRLKEIPYVCGIRHTGESKTASSLLGFLRRGWKYVFMVLRLRFTSC